METIKEGLSHKWKSLDSNLKSFVLILAIAIIILIILIIIRRAIANNKRKKDSISNSESSSFVPVFSSPFKAESENNMPNLENNKSENLENNKNENPINDNPVNENNFERLKANSPNMVGSHSRILPPLDQRFNRNAQYPVNISQISNHGQSMNTEPAQARTYPVQMQNGSEIQQENAINTKRLVGSAGVVNSTCGSNCNGENLFGESSVPLMSNTAQKEEPFEEQEMKTPENSQRLAENHNVPRTNNYPHTLGSSSYFSQKRSNATSISDIINERLSFNNGSGINNGSSQGILKRPESSNNPKPDRRVRFGGKNDE